MQNKIASRIMSLFLVLASIFTILPQQAFALPSSPPVDAFAGAGGGGTGGGGGEGTGKWDGSFQGYRITVLDYAGEPAFTFNGKDHLDLIYTHDRGSKYTMDKIASMDYFCGGNKTSFTNKKFNYKNIGAMNTSIYEIGDVTNKLRLGIWDTAVPRKADEPIDGKMVGDKYVPGPGDMKWNNRCWDLKVGLAKSLPKPIKATDDGNYSGQGKALRAQLYGAGEKITDDAYLYILLNLQDSKSKTWAWQPKASAELGDNKFTSEELEWYRTGKRDGQQYFPTDLMSEKEIAISVEPIIWNKLRLTWTKDNPGADQFSYGVYGTQSSIANVTSYLENKGWFKPQSWAKGIGGCDTSIFGNVGRRALDVGSIGVTFSAYKDQSGKIVKEDWTVAQPTAKGTYITDDEIRASNTGWGVQLYVLRGGKPSVPSTSTCDEPLIPTPHTAPDPSKIPKLPDEQVDKTRVYNIVKTYRDRVEDESGNEIVEHVATYSRQKNPALITIEDERTYKVKEWFISETYNNPTSSTTWEDNHNQAPTTGPTGKGTGTTEIKPKNTTLYVLLEKEQPKPKEGDLVIEESQVTKAVETMTSSVTGWGPQTMTFKANDISGACPYIFYHSCEDCSYSWQCSAPYVLNDRAWNYNHKNTTPIDGKIHADGGVFKPINDRGTDAKGERDTVSEYTNFVDTFNYKLVVWRGEDVPTIANYKEQSSNPLNTLVKRYGKEPAGQRYSPYSGKGLSYNRDLLITLDKDGGLGDYTTTSVTDHGYSKSATHANINTLNYDTQSTVKVYYGKAHEKGNLTAAGTQAFTTTLVGKPSAPKYSGGQMKQSGEVTWYPYIRMTYQTTGVKDPTRTNVNILSQYISELTPNDYVEAAWVSTKDYNMNLKSAQWSLHSA